MRLSQAARKLNTATTTIVEFLKEKGHEVENNPNAKITDEQFQLLVKEFQDAALEKQEASTKTIRHIDKTVVIKSEDRTNKDTENEDEEEEVLVKSRESKTIESSTKKEDKAQPHEEKTSEQPRTDEENTGDDAIERPKVGLKILGKIDLDAIEKKPAKKQKSKKKATSKQEVAQSKKESSPVAENKETPAPQTQKQETKEVPPAKEEKEEVVEVSQEEKKEAIEEKQPAVEQVQEEKPAEVKKEEAAVEPDNAKEVEGEEEEEDVIRGKAEKLEGLKVLGKIELPDKKKKKAKPIASSDERKRSRVRIKKNKKDGDNKTDNRQSKDNRNQDNRSHRTKSKKKAVEKKEISSKEVKEQLKATLAKISGAGKKKVSRKRKEKVEIEGQEVEKNVLQVTEFISTAELASLMDVPVNEVITKCIQSGIFVSINQRLEADIIELIASEYGYDVEFISAEEEITVDIEEEEDNPEDLVPRPPVVTVMGHVDHGKTSLLDYIRNTNVTAKEAGGITQHIGAYSVTTADGKKVTFLDTPGHEAFTAMRARGAKVTDVAIIVVAADDSVMPQTVEAINHAQAAGVPIVIAINKIDKPTANPDRVKEQLAKINILVEDWGGPYQCQHVSAKTGEGIDELLEKVLLEAELLELKANPKRKASGTVIEAALDKGKGYVATLLVQNGTLHVGDIVLAGTHYGRVKAMTDHTGKRIKEAGPSTPVQILGLNGAPQAGDKFNVMDSDKEAREIANKREQILREQRIRATERISLETLSRRRALGDYKQLNLIVKGDVDGSVEALSDALLKLSKPDEIEVRIVHRGVGQITESDVNLAAVSDAIIIGFQVRPSANAKKLAEQEHVEIRLYSVIYDVINDVKDAMEGMLAPTVEEVIVGNAEVREVFHISKVGTVAGCYVTDGYIKRNLPIRVVRDGTVIHTGELASLKRFKDDVSEVKAGFECGLAVKSFNDIQVGDIIEAFERREVKRTLD
ncbi:translation initiation factor IF-2 [Thermonema rossianum]|uniref:translation initiation factor IF-2 n=1 Tax=Thermonema rossianum TaxID=55505 RepID=UPI0012F8D21F|nr:translation initiation factor IF-2 [Thermonema rossianum]